MKEKCLYTIGHSTRSLDELIHILEHYQIRILVDVRSMPGSRRVPDFDKENLEPALAASGIRYVHLRALGGLRHTTKTSVNTGWRNKSFRGFADYMQTADFEQGLDMLIGLADQAPTAIMCAEAVPWRCHRSLIGDAMLARGFTVVDIFSEQKTELHHLTAFAKVEGEKITYPEMEK